MFLNVLDVSINSLAEHALGFKFQAFCGRYKDMATADPLVLSRFRAVLEALYGPRIERVVLYGSRARGDADADSDYDVAVFLKDLEDRWAETAKIARAAVTIFDETGGLIHAMPYAAGSYLARTPLMHEMRREGVDL